MPEPRHPPYVSGAVVIPRQLNRWLDVNPQNGPLTRTSTYITLPAFAQTDVWNGYSDIVASFNVESPNNISLKNYNVPTSPNYVLCVSYRVGGVVTRYLLWDADSSNLNQTIPAYTGQVLLKNFRFEVWNTSQGATSQASAITFYTSKRGNVDYRFGDDSALVATDAENDNFHNTSTSGVSATRMEIVGAGDSQVNGNYTYNSGSGRWVKDDDALVYLGVDGDGWLLYNEHYTFPDYFRYSTANADFSAPWDNTGLSGQSPVPTNANIIVYTLPLVFPTAAVSTTN